MSYDFNFIRNEMVLSVNDPAAWILFFRPLFVHHKMFLEKDDMNMKVQCTTMEEFSFLHGTTQCFLIPCLVIYEISASADGPVG